MSAPADEHHDYEKVGRAFDLRLIRRLMPFARPNAVWFLGGLLLLFVIASLEITGPFILRKAIDGPVAAAGDAARSEQISELLLLAGAYVLLLLLTMGCRYAQFIVLNTAGQRVLDRIRRRVFEQLQRLPVAWFDRNPTGRLVSRVTTDIETLNELFTSGAVTLVGDVVKIVVILTVVFLIHPGLGLVAIIAVPALALASAFFRIRARQAYRETRSAIARVTAYLGESIAGVRVLQGFSREDRALSRFAGCNRGYLTANLRTVFYFALFFPVVDGITIIVQGGTFWRGGMLVLGDTLTLGQFLQFWLYLGHMFEPLRELAEKYNILQSAMASAERVFDVLDTETEQPDPPDAIRAEAVGREGGLLGEIAFQEVTFGYRPDEQVLDRISFQVRPGETIALVGATGGGKTTITSLLMRFYEPDSGRILLDGEPLQRYARRALRSRIAYVPQDVFLFTGTLLDNLTLGNPEVSESTARAAARALGAEKMIDGLADGFQHHLAERGSNLSVGERQILSFARAFAIDPAILILDEATASVDPVTEGRIQQAIRTLLEGRTSIVVAHRLSTIREADRILVLHHGRIREQGSHEELLEKGGLYSMLYRIQFNEGNNGSGPA